MRRTETHFGTFDQLVGTAVHANGWWLRAALGVDLQCESPDCFDLSTFAAGVDAVRVRRALHVALQMGDEPLDFPVGFVACRVEDATDGQRTDIAYPFGLLESEGPLQLAFGTPGPTPAVRRAIIDAFAQRLASVLER